MSLTERQRKHLRRLAHSMKPVLAIGDKGATPAFVQELDRALEHHELLKVRVRTGDRDARDELIDQLQGDCHAELISRVGNIATLYRGRRKNPGITLPPPG